MALLTLAKVFLDWILEKEKCFYIFQYMCVYRLNFIKVRKMPDFFNSNKLKPKNVSTKYITYIPFHFGNKLLSNNFTF